MKIINSFEFPMGRSLNSLSKVELLNLPKNLPFTFDKWEWLSETRRTWYSANPNCGVTLLFRKYCQKGRILEPMCGGATRVEDTGENTIIGLDLGIDGLFNDYPHNRRRIYCDLSDLASEEGNRTFFASGEFDVIVESLGYKYPKDIVAVFREFHRILNPKGVFVMFENTQLGNSNAVRRFLGTNEDKERMRAGLLSAGFTSVNITKVESHHAYLYNLNPESYIIEARKS